MALPPPSPDQKGVTFLQNAQRSEMLGAMPMKRLVPKISLPIMVSMLVQALYNVVDSIFVSRYDPNCLTAVSLAYPIQMLMMAVSVGMGVGINSLISRKLGERRSEEARTAAWNGLFIELAGCLLFITVGVCFAGQCMGLVVSPNLQNAETIRQLGTVYLGTVTSWSAGVFMAILFERMLQATGNTLLSMATQMTGALVNIILDPILIFGYLGCPAMGVQGAAVATVIGQFCSAALGFTFNQLKNPELRLRLSECRLDANLLKGILAVGLPSTMMQTMASVMNVGLNALLSGFAQGNAAVNVLNVYFKLQSFVFMPVFGLGSGMVAIVGYNFGARLKDRVHEAVRVALTWALSILAVGMILFLTVPEHLMRLFEPEEASEITLAMTSMGVVALRTICLHFPLAAVGITLSNVFQAIGRGLYSLIISLCRQLVVLLPAAWLLGTAFGTVDAVWWAFIIAEGVSATLSFLFWRQCDRKIISRL